MPNKLYLAEFSTKLKLDLALDLDVGAYREGNKLLIELTSWAIAPQLTFNLLQKLSNVLKTTKLNVLSSIEHGYYPGDEEAMLTIEAVDFFKKEWIVAK